MYNKNSGNYDFRKDIILGEEGEQEIVNYLKTLGFTYISDNKDNKYDLLMEYNGREITYEIKTDIYPRDTGNLAIEVECRGKPSGIYITEADYFVYYFKHIGEIWNIKVSKLKHLLKHGNFYLSENSGDKYSNTKLYLLRKSVVKPYFKVHKIKYNV